MTHEHDQTTQKQQQQEHCHCHHDAAESHEQAAKHHKEAAKCHDAGDAKAAAHYAHIAHGHSIQAGEHEAECSKKYAKTHDVKILEYDNQSFKELPVFTTSSSK